MTQRAMVDVEAAEIASVDEEESFPVQEVLAAIQTALERVPAEHRDQARLVVKTTGDYAHAYVEIRYSRPETDEELASRARMEEGYRREAEAAQRRQYEALKAKFG